LRPGAVIGLEMIEHGLRIAPTKPRHKTGSAPGRSRKPAKRESRSAFRHAGLPDRRNGPIPGSLTIGREKIATTASSQTGSGLFAKAL
jgi:hypothetical protein